VSQDPTDLDPARQAPDRLGDAGRQHKQVDRLAHAAAALALGFPRL
jgi:hypothetical protein